jgi:hypothetical protein
MLRLKNFVIGGLCYLSFSLIYASAISGTDVVLSNQKNQAYITVSHALYNYDLSPESFNKLLADNKIHLSHKIASKNNVVVYKAEINQEGINNLKTSFSKSLDNISGSTICAINDKCQFSGGITADTGNSNNEISVFPYYKNDKLFARLEAASKSTNRNIFTNSDIEVKIKSSYIVISGKAESNTYIGQIQLITFSK